MGTPVTLGTLTGCAGVVATTYTFATEISPPFTSEKANCCTNTCCSTDTTATDACCNKNAKAAKATVGGTAGTLVVSTYFGTITFPFPNCAVPVPSPPPPSPAAAPEPVLAPTTNTDTALPSALTTVLAALTFFVLFVGLPGFGVAGLGRKKRSLKKKNGINDRLDEATSVIKNLIEAAQESYGIEADCSDATVVE